MTSISLQHGKFGGEEIDVAIRCPEIPVPKSGYSNRALRESPATAARAAIP